MTDSTKQDLDDLFSMFHDFEITHVTFENDILDLTIRIPWGELWNDLDYQIRVVLNGCKFIKCEYAEIMNTPENFAKNWVDRSSIDKSSNDPKIISELGLEVQRYNFYLPNKYEFLCNSSKNYAGGQLTFTADNYNIFGKHNIQMGIDQMKKWCTEWWQKIEDQ